MDTIKLKIMKTIVTFLVMLTLIAYSQAFGQQSKENLRKMPSIKELIFFNDTDILNSSFISKNPTTNKEYLTYLCWVNSIYIDFPDKLIDAFPGTIHLIMADSIIAKLHKKNTHASDRMKIMFQLCEKS